MSEEKDGRKVKCELKDKNKHVARKNLEEEHVKIGLEERRMRIVLFRPILDAQYADHEAGDGLAKIRKNFVDADHEAGDDRAEIRESFSFSPFRFFAVEQIPHAQQQQIDKEEGDENPCEKEEARDDVRKKWWQE